MLIKFRSEILQQETKYVQKRVKNYLIKICFPVVSVKFAHSFAGQLSGFSKILAVNA